MSQPTLNINFYDVKVEPRILGFISSLFTHMFIFLLFFYYYCVIHNQSTTSDSNEQVIVIDLVAPPNSIISETIKLNTLLTPNKAKSDFTDHEMEPLKNLSNIEKSNLDPIAEEKPIISDTTTSLLGPLEIRYGIIFASHIKRFALQIPDKVNYHKKIEIMLKMDREGNIREYNVLNTKNKAIKQVVDKIIQLAAPYPKPPIEAFSSDFIIYKFYLSFN
jgi:hypothetical protein